MSGKPTVNLCSDCVFQHQAQYRELPAYRGQERRAELVKLVPCGRHLGLELRDARAKCLGAEWVADTEEARRLHALEPLKR
jgi:hypothetical protein